MLGGLQRITTSAVSDKTRNPQQSSTQAGWVDSTSSPSRWTRPTLQLVTKPPSKVCDDVHVAALSAIASQACDGAFWPSAPAYLPMEAVGKVEDVN